jgi:hypothetical protein
MKTIKILVVDDKILNLNNAKEQFKDKNVELTCCPLFSVAADLLKRNNYDILLTDLMLPGESNGISDTNPEIGVEVPYGLVLSILAKKIGVSHVAILTDVSHHSGPIANAMDTLLGESDFISCFANKQWLAATEKFVTLIDVLDNKQVSAKKSLMLAGFNDDFKELLKKELDVNFDIMIIDEKSTAKLPTIYTEVMPDYLFLIGEINEKAKEIKSYIKKIFDDIKQIQTSGQKVVVSGFWDSNDPYYKRLPFTATDLATTLNESL